MKNLIIIGGTMGVGKSATCRELQKLLPKNVFLDGDWCWDMQPFIVTHETKAMVMGNIAHLLGSFIRCSEFENVIFCWVLHEWAIFDDLISRLPTEDCTVHWFSLTCNEKTLTDRLALDVASGLRAPDIIKRSIARLPMYEAIGGVNIDVSEITASEAAKQIAKKVSG